MIQKKKLLSLNKKIARMWVDAGGTAEDWRVQWGNIESIINDLTIVVEDSDTLELFGASIE
jgi:hypothetical protein